MCKVLQPVDERCERCEKLEGEVRSRCGLAAQEAQSGVEPFGHVPDGGAMTVGVIFGGLLRRASSSEKVMSDEGEVQDRRVHSQRRAVSPQCWMLGSGRCHCGLRSMGEVDDGSPTLVQVQQRLTVMGRQRSQLVAVVVVLAQMLVERIGEYQRRNYCSSRANVNVQSRPFGACRAAYVLNATGLVLVSVQSFVMILLSLSTLMLTLTRLVLVVLGLVEHFVMPLALVSSLLVTWYWS